jgi:hypothetical protein
VLSLQIIWPLSLKQLPSYAADRDSVVFPVPEVCPHCRSSRPLIRHGFYSRNAVVKAGNEYRIDIRRYICASCLVTISLLPWFLLPFFQHVRPTILEALRARFTGHLVGVLSRELAGFHQRRFRRNIPAIITSLREIGWRESLPLNEHEKAIKVIGRLLTRPSEATASSFSTQLPNNFMALSL